MAWSRTFTFLVVSLLISNISYAFVSLSNLDGQNSTSNQDLFINDFSSTYELNSKAISFILENQDNLRVRSDLGNTSLSTDDLVVDQVSETPDRIVVRLQQVLNGTKVIGAEAVLGFNVKNHQLLYVESSLTNLPQAIPNVEWNERELVGLLHRGNFADKLRTEVFRHLELLDNQHMNNSLLVQTISDLRNDLSSFGALEIDKYYRLNNNELEATWLLKGLTHHKTLFPVAMEIIAYGPRMGLVGRVTSLAQTSTSDILIYDAYANPAVPLISKGTLVLKNGQSSSVFTRPLISQEAREADDAFVKTLKFYFVNFNRDGFDNHGAAVNAAVRVQKLKIFDFYGLQQNAAWIGTLNVFVFGGGGEYLANFTSALDVIGHEFTHAVVEHTSKLVYANESGALNEHLADVFGIMIRYFSNQAQPGEEFLIGPTVVTQALKDKIKQSQHRDVRALRDMMNPKEGIVVQPGHVSEIPAEYNNCTPTQDNDQCGVHITCGVPSRAVALMISKIGWGKTKQLIYNVMTSRLTSNATFKSYATAIRNECGLFLSEADCRIVDQQLVTVGI